MSLGLRTFFSYFMLLGNCDFGSITIFDCFVFFFSLKGDGTESCDSNFLSVSGFITKSSGIMIPFSISCASNFDKLL